MYSFDLNFKENHVLTVNEEMGRSLAQVMRRARLDENKTLKQQSQGICSLSYLCKLENNTIQPSEWYLRSLFEKMHIDYDKAVRIEKRHSVDHAILCFLNEDRNGLDDILKDVDDKTFDVKVSISRGLKAYFDKDVQRISAELERIDVVRNTFSQCEAFGALLLGGLGYLLERNYRDAVTYFHKLWHHLPNRPHYKEVALIYAARAEYVLNDYANFIDHYEMIHALDMYAIPLSTSQEMLTDRLAFATRESAEQALAQLAPQIPHLSGRERSRAIIGCGLINLKKKNYRGVFESIRAQQFESDPAAAPLLAMTAILSGDRLQKKEALNVMEPLIRLEADGFRSLFFALARKRLLDEKFDIEDLRSLKTRADTILKRQQDHFLSPAVARLILEAFSAVGHYKETITFFQDHKQECLAAYNL